MTPNEKTGLYDFLVRACQEHGFTTNATYEALHNAVDSILNMGDYDSMDSPDEEPVRLAPEMSVPAPHGSADTQSMFRVLVTLQMGGKWNEPVAAQVASVLRSEGTTVLKDVRVEQQDPNTGVWKSA